MNRLPTILWLFLLVCPAPIPQAHAEEYQDLVSKYGDAIVTIRYVLEVKGFGGDKAQESESQISGVVIGPNGLVLCSNAVLGGLIIALQSMFLPIGDAEKPVITPTEIKVFVGKGSEGLPGTLLARDTEMDLAWIQIDNPQNRRFAFVDLSKAAEPKLGQRLLSLWRKSRAFDSALMVGEGRVAGVTSRPRALYFPSGDLGSVLGLPVFSAAGQPLGVCVLQLPEAEGEGKRPSPMEMMGFFLRLPELSTGSILPAAEIVKSTERAVKSASKK